MFKLFKKNKKEETPKIEKMYEVTYSVCNSKGYVGTYTEKMTESELNMMRADWMYYDVEEAWEL